MALGALLLRITIGGLFIGHGAQKLFGAFGGHGLESTAGFFESLGLQPGRRSAVAAGAAEAGGGALLALGAATPLATTALSATMLTAVRKVHWQNGPWVSNGGWEYNAVLIAALTALAEQGPGPMSVHPELRGRRWALLTLAGATAGSFATTALAGGNGAGGGEAAEGQPGDPATDEAQPS